MGLLFGDRLSFFVWVCSGWAFIWGPVFVGLDFLFIGLLFRVCVVISSPLPLPLFVSASVGFVARFSFCGPFSLSFGAAENVEGFV